MPEILGARPIGPGDLDDLWGGQKQKEIINRAKYIIHGNLEEPPHIREAWKILRARGRDWVTASEDEICEIIDNLPSRLFGAKIWTTSPWPKAQEHEFADITKRIFAAEWSFYLAGDSPAGHLFYMIHQANNNNDPQSFGQRVNRAGISINKVMHFTRNVVYRSNDITALSKPFKIDEKAEVLAGDFPRALKSMQDGFRDIPLQTYKIPTRNDDRYITEGILNIDSQTLVFDTTLNNSVLQVIKEADLRPGIIIKELTFWRDGDDQDTERLANVSYLDYGVTHWLTEHYDVFSRPRGGGFVTCSPTIYIRKSTSLPRRIKKSIEDLFSRPGSSRG
ncbi:hypothetical protein VTK26DRAFT_6123 [Humicola hyalothermophila]